MTVTTHRVPAPVGLPRLFAAGPADVATEGLTEHLAHHGSLLLRGYGGSNGPTPLIDIVERAGLTGRGGAGFPTARKLRAVASRGGGAVVVVNAAEGEPASAKDRALLHGRPHLVLDGAVLAADAVGARQIFVGVHTGYAAAVEHAVAERQGHGLDRVPIRVVEVGTAYVASQESALVQMLSGGRALPTFVPPRPDEKGVRGRPTLVNNAETLAHLALLARHGDGWFRSVGTPEAPGSVLVTLRGALRAPGVYEVAFGTPIRDVFELAGGFTEAVQAVLVGGYFGSWVPAERALDTPLTPEALRTVGAALGAGVLLALPNSACGVTETARVTGWLAGQSAGQCGPCKFGLPAIAADVADLSRGSSDPRLRRRLDDRLRLVEGRGACRHPDGTAKFVASALQVFSTELRAHAGGRCAAAGRPPVLPLPGDRVIA